MTAPAVPATKDDAGYQVGPGRPPLHTRFQKGQSGNPTGRRKTVDHIRKLAEQQSEKALNKIVELMDSSDERVAYMAATKIVEIAGITPKQLENDNTAKSAAVTVNIVRYDGNDNAAPQLDATPVSVRTLGTA